MTQSEDEKILAVFEPMDTTIVAHELTHLYFHTFFDEKSAQPPSWLDEGLAGMLQDEALTRPDPRGNVSGVRLRWPGFDRHL